VEEEETAKLNLTLEAIFSVNSDGDVTICADMFQISASE
jgi:hypothetical protein